MSAPPLVFTSDNSTGFYRGGDGGWRLAIEGRDALGLLADVRPPPEVPHSVWWACFGLALLSIVLVIYWLTEKPRLPRSRYTLPTSSESEARRFERPLRNPPTRIDRNRSNIERPEEKP